MKRIKPMPGQESVWDYHRPPKIEAVRDHIRVIFNNTIICDTNTSFRILETSHPPTFYLPVEKFVSGVLIKTNRTSFCEFKGMAHYYHVKVGEQIADFAAWGYDSPNSAYQSIAGHVSIYAHKMDECLVGEERVQPQEGDFYGGWITSKVVGPFKGGPGTWGW